MSKYNFLNRFFNNKPVTNVVNKTNESANIKKNYIGNYQTSRTKQDIGKWREAIIEMEQPLYPHRVKVQNIYNDTVLNGHVKACINKRKNLTLLQEFAFIGTNGEIDETTTNNIFKKKWFVDTINYVLDTQFYGYTLINWTEILNGLPNNITIINRENINPDKMIVGNYPYSNTGLDINSKDIYNWSLYSSTISTNGISNCGYGLLYEVAIYEILLRNLLGYNSDFAEKYGQPTIMVDTMKTDESERGYLESMIQNLGASGYIIKDATDVINYLEYSQAGDGYTVYTDLEKRCEAKISKLLLGHSDAIDSTPGKLGSTQGEDNPIAKALNVIKTIDSNFVQYYVNDVLLDKLKKLGIKIPEGRFEFLNNTEKELQEEKDLMMVKEISNFTKMLYDSGVKVDINWLSKKLQIPLTNITVPETTTPTNSIEVKKKITIVNKVDETILDSIGDRIYNGENIVYDYELFKAITEELLPAIDSKVKNSVLSERTEQLHNVFKTNIYEFSTAKVQAQIDDVNLLFKQDLPYNEFRDGVKALNLEYNRDYLKTEYDTAKSSVLNSDEYLAKSNRYKYAMWKQIQRVTKRDDHVPLNGKTMLVSNLPGIPPLGWNCGCELTYTNTAPNEITSPKKFKELADWDLVTEQGFNTNPAKTGKIFTKMYGDFNRVVNGKDKGLTPIDEILGSELFKTVTKTITKNILLNPDEKFLINDGDNYKYNYIKYYNDVENKVVPVTVVETFGLDKKPVYQTKELSKLELDEIRNNSILIEKK